MAEIVMEQVKKPVPPSAIRRPPGKGIKPKARPTVLSGLSCSEADPLVVLSAAVIGQAMSQLCKGWQGNLPEHEQDEKTLDAYDFLLYGSEGLANPFVHHHMAGVSVIAEMAPGEFLRRLLAQRKSRPPRKKADRVS